MTSTARKVFDQTKTFIVVALLTVLIWMLAEAESLRTDTFRVEIAFRATPETGRLVRIEPNQEFVGFVQIRVEGPTTRVHALSAALRNRLTLEPGMDGVPLEPGRHHINLAEVLRSHTIMRDSRVTLANVDPSNVTVFVDNLVTRDLPVRVELDPGFALEGAPEVIPPAVRVRMPELVALQLPEGTQLIARPAPEDVLTLTEGRRGELRGIPVELPPALRGIDGVRPAPPAQVTVALTLRSRTANYTIPTVPLHLRLPPAEAALWDIQIPREFSLLTDVVVSGPSDLIDEIREGRTRPIAYLALTFEELERAALASEPLQAQITFSDLPTPLRFEPRQRTIPITVRRRDNNSDSPAPVGTP